MYGLSSLEGPSKAERGPSEQRQHSAHNPTLNEPPPSIIPYHYAGSSYYDNSNIDVPHPPLATNHIYPPPPNTPHALYEGYPPLPPVLPAPYVGELPAFPSEYAQRTSPDLRDRTPMDCKRCIKRKITCSGREITRGGKCFDCWILEKECIFSKTPASATIIPTGALCGPLPQKLGAYSPFNQPSVLVPHQEGQVSSPGTNSRQFKEVKKRPREKSRSAYAVHDVTNQRPLKLQPMARRTPERTLQIALGHQDDAYEGFSSALAEAPAILREHERSVRGPGEKSGHDFQSDWRTQSKISRESSELSAEAGLSTRSITPSSSPTESTDIDLVSISGDSESTGQLDSNSQGFQIFSRVFRRLAVLVAVLGVREVMVRGESSGSSSKGKQVAKGGSASSSGTRDGTSATRGRKNRRQGDDQGDEGRDRKNEPPSKRGKTSQSQCGGRSRFLACPYWKSDPEKYWDCFLKKNDTIAHLKQHLTRRHTPKYYCQICYETFREFDLFDSHALERSCTRGPSAKLEGISQQQKNQLSLKSKGSVEQQWYTVWSILFPDTNPPATIYIRSTQSEDFCRIQEFAQREGVAIMLEELDSSGLVVRPDLSNQQLRSTVQRAMVSIFRTYSIRREPNSEETEELGFNESGESTHGVSLQQEVNASSQMGQGNLTSIDANRMMADDTDDSFIERLNKPNRSTRSQLPTAAPWLPSEVVQDQPWGPAFLDEPALRESSSGNDVPFNFESSDMLDLDALLRDVISTEA